MCCKGAVFLSYRSVQGRRDLGVCDKPFEMQVLLIAMPTLSQTGCQVSGVYTVMKLNCVQNLTALSVSLLINLITQTFFIIAMVFHSCMNISDSRGIVLVR